MRVDPSGAQRASDRTRSGRLLTLVAAAIALIGVVVFPSTASATSLKVVIVVGPVESMTSTYIADARALAKQARSYGAAVTEIYSPNATWSRVRPAVQGANLLIYLGHGNGTPSPYPYSRQEQERSRAERGRRARERQRQATTASTTSRRTSTSPRTPW